MSEYPRTGDTGLDRRGWPVEHEHISDDFGEFECPVAGCHWNAPITPIADMAQAMREVAKDDEKTASAIGRFLSITTEDGETRGRQMLAARLAFGEEPSPLFDAFRQGWHLGRQGRNR